MPRVEVRSLIFARAGRDAISVRALHEPAWIGVRDAQGVKFVPALRLTGAYL